MRLLTAVSGVRVPQQAPHTPLRGVFFVLKDSNPLTLKGACSAPLAEEVRLLRYSVTLFLTGGEALRRLLGSARRMFTAHSLHRRAKDALLTSPSTGATHSASRSVFYNKKTVAQDDGFSGGRFFYIACSTATATAKHIQSTTMNAPSAGIASLVYGQLHPLSMKVKVNLVKKTVLAKMSPPTSE